MIPGLLIVTLRKVVKVVNQLWLFRCVHCQLGLVNHASGSLLASGDTYQICHSCPVLANGH